MDADPDADPAAHDLERVLATARLARLELDGERAAQLAPQFARILESFRSLSELDLSAVEPLASPAGLCDVARDDVVRAGLEREVLLEAAAEREGEFLRVPRAVGGQP